MLSAEAHSIHPLAHLLFADKPIDGSVKDALGVSTYLKFNDREGAIRRLNSAYTDPTNESRMRLTAAATLRNWDVPVQAEEPLLGVVIEYPVETGVDYVAAYADGSARYLNFSGGAVIWDTPRTVAEIDAALIALLNSAMAMLPHTTDTGPWSPATSVRITCLTLTGNRAFTPPGAQQALQPFNACIAAAISLMGLLIDRSQAQGR
ncbi:MAG TPA: hypothetical protein VFF65_01045 [Phycisphaerales bacterium]|nr:hypothetical protein [Phycisphaerales bacterium]